jgi:hypothetical protein
MNRQRIFRKLVLGVTLAGLALVASWAIASNMGFKLNLGNLNAINRILRGSGVSLGAEENSLVVNLDLANQDLSPKNSNMGFKLNIQSFPAEDEPILIDVEGEEYLLQWVYPAVGAPYLSFEPLLPPG